MTVAIVITGDIVKSKDLDSDRLTAALRALEDGADRLGAWVGEDLHFTRHRGDGWQICLSMRISALRAALAMRAALRRSDPALQTRMALAVGEVSLPEDGNLNTAQGPAFIASGQLLDQLTSAEIADARGGAEGAAARLAHHISDSWTQAQARAVCPMLAPERPTQEQVAEELGISRQAVRQALQAAGFFDIVAALDLLEAP